MKRKCKRLFLVATAFVLAALQWNCGGNSTTTGSNTIDLAVMDRDYVDDNNYQVMLWYDVLANSGPGLPPPDITLDPEERTPVDGLFYNGDLYVGATANGTASEGGVLIYRDYLTLADGDVPDAVLTGTTLVTGPESGKRIAIDDDVLVTVDAWYGTPAFFVWGGASDLADGAAPDAAVDEVAAATAAGAWRPYDVVLVGSRLYVSNNQTTVDAVEPVIAIWSDVGDLVANGASAADVELTDDTNFLDLGQYGGQIAVANDILYVAGEDDVAGLNGPYIFIFNEASGITSSSLPDNVLVGCVDSSADDGCYIESPPSITVDDNDILWVANKNENNTSNDNPAVAGFALASELVQNQPPTIAIGHTTGLAQAERVVGVGGALFITGSPDSYDGWDRKGIFIFRNASGISNGDAADLSAMGDSFDDDADDVADLVFLKFPTGIAATVRGTFDNFVDLGT